MRKFFTNIHLWLSIPAGLILSVVCLTGALLSFDKEILEWIYPERYFVEHTAGREPLPIEELVAMANDQLSNNSVANIQISSDRSRTYTLGLKEGMRVSAFQNPYTGEITGIYRYQEGFFYKMMALHRWLMDGSRTVGKVTVGIGTALFVVILLTGIVIWFPVDRRLFRDGFKVYFSKGATRLLRDLHTTLGMYAFLLLLVCSLTGLMWSFEGYRNTVFGIFGVEAPQGSPGRGRGGQPDTEAQLDVSRWDDVYSKLAAANPEFEYIRLQDKSVSVLAADAPHDRASDRYVFDPQSGEITSENLYREAKSTSKVMSWAYALHVGSYWGFFGRLITCLASLVGASLPITGYYMYFVKLRASYKTRKELKAL